MVPGADSSAFISLAKLRNYCNQHGATIVHSSLSPAIHDALEGGGFAGGKSLHQGFTDIHVAVGWCEDKLLADSKLKDDSDFAAWLQGYLGAIGRSHCLSRTQGVRRPDGAASAR